MHNDSFVVDADQKSLSVYCDRAKKWRLQGLDRPERSQFSSSTIARWLQDCRSKTASVLNDIPGHTRRQIFVDRGYGLSEHEEIRLHSYTPSAVTKILRTMEALLML